LLSWLAATSSTQSGGGPSSPSRARLSWTVNMEFGGNLVPQRASLFWGEKRNACDNIKAKAVW